jgi:hypothetical protein
LSEKPEKKDVIIRVDANNSIFATVIRQGGALDIRLHRGKKRKAQFPILNGDFILVPAESSGGFILVPVGSVVTRETIQQALDKMSVRYVLSNPIDVMGMIVAARKQFKFEPISKGKHARGKRKNRARSSAD